MTCRRRPVDLSTGTLAQIACILEVTAPKPGNVHPGRDFSDCNWIDFLLAAAACAPVFDRASSQDLGRTVLEAVRASRAASGRNVNLGAILLLAPLAAAAPGEEPRRGVKRVLRGLGPQDCSQVYEAIRLADPGGLGKVAESDVRDAPPPDLIRAMALAEDRDLVARQYARDFADVFDTALPALEDALGRGLPLDRAVVLLALRLLRRFPDSLIGRKCGIEVAREASRRAARVLERGWPESPESAEDFADLDRWMRADGNRRNPGTTADVIAATLFLALRAGIISLPL